MMSLGERPYAEIDGLGFMFWNWSSKSMTILAGFGQNATVMGSDLNTTLLCFGKGDVTFFGGDGNNIAFGSVGNDVFVGGSGGGVNKFFGGAGDDLLIRGEGYRYSDLNGGVGNDTIVFGQWDNIAGGLGADRFIFAPKTSTPDAGFVSVRDLSFAQGDILDLSMMQIPREYMSVQDDTLVCWTPEGALQINGVGNEITLVGGIDAAINVGDLLVFGWGGKG